MSSPSTSQNLLSTSLSPRNVSRRPSATSTAQPSPTNSMLSGKLPDSQQRRNSALLLSPNQNIQHQRRRSSVLAQQRKEEEPIVKTEVSVIAQDEVDFDEDGMIFEVSQRPEDFPKELLLEQRKRNEIPHIEAVKDDDDDHDESSSSSRSTCSGGTSNDDDDDEAESDDESSDDEEFAKRRKSKINPGDSPTTAFLQVLVSEDEEGNSISGSANNEKLLWCASRGTQCELMNFNPNKKRRRSSFEGIVDITASTGNSSGGLRTSAGVVKNVSVYSRTKRIVAGPLSKSETSSRRNSRGLVVGDEKKTSLMHLPPVPQHFATDEVYCVPLGDYRAHQAQLVERDDVDDDTTSSSSSSESSCDTQSDGENNQQGNDVSFSSKGESITSASNGIVTTLGVTASLTTSMQSNQNQRITSPTTPPKSSGEGNSNNIRLRRLNNSTTSPSTSVTTYPIGLENRQSSTLSAVGVGKFKSGINIEIPKNEQVGKNQKSKSNKKKEHRRRNKEDLLVHAETIKQIHHSHRRNSPTATSGIQRIGPNQYSTGLTQNQMHRVQHKNQSPNENSDPRSIISLQNFNDNIRVGSPSLSPTGLRRKVRDKVTMTEMRSVWKATKFKIPSPELTHLPEVASPPTFDSGSLGFHSKVEKGKSGSVRKLSPPTSSKQQQNYSNKKQQSGLLGSHSAKSTTSEKLREKTDSKVAMNSRFSVATPVSKRKASSTITTLTTPAIPKDSSSKKKKDGSNKKSGKSNNNNNETNTLAIEYYEGIGIILRPMSDANNTLLQKRHHLEQQQQYHRDNHQQQHMMDHEQQEKEQKMNNSGYVIAGGAFAPPSPLLPGTATTSHGGIVGETPAVSPVKKERETITTGAIFTPSPPSRKDAFGNDVMVSNSRRRSSGPKQVKPMLPSISRPFEVDERVIPPIPNVKTYSAKEYNNNNNHSPSKKSHHYQNDDDEQQQQKVDSTHQQEAEKKRRRKEKHHNKNQVDQLSQQHEDVITKRAESPQPKFPLLEGIPSPEKKSFVQDPKKSMLHFASVLEANTSSRNPLAQLGGTANNTNKRRKSSVDGFTHGFASQTLKKSITGKSMINSKSFRDQMNAKTARDAKQQALHREKEFQRLFPEWPAKAGGASGSMSL